MNTMYKSSKGVTIVPIESHLLSKRKLYINGEITLSSACEFVMEITLLVEEDAEKPIDIFINSQGGDLRAGFMIYDVLKGLKTEVNLHCQSIAFSMAAIILASGKKGHRFAMPHSEILIHEPFITGGVGGSASSIERTAESILKKKRMSVEALSSDTGKTEKEIEDAISIDNFMNAEEAIAFGICDSIETSIV